MGDSPLDMLSPDGAGITAGIGSRSGMSMTEGDLPARSPEYTGDIIGGP